jgi:putative membrane protein
MKTVVLCIDRDNDLGEKAGIKGPIIGRKDNLGAAMKLALADPEDTDLNTIFAAVRLYDQLKMGGRDVEVVTVTGDRSVGLKSDEKISHQIDVIVQVLKADSAVIVTDGGEDEFVMPLIQSRLKILNVTRVIVKSLPTGKETVSILRKYMQEERFKIQIVLPISLAMLTYVVFGVFGAADYFYLAFAAVIGGYLAMNALRVPEGLHALSRTIRVGVATSRLSLGGSALALVLLSLGAVVAVQYIIAGTSPGGILPQGQTPSDIAGMLVLFAVLYAPVTYAALMVRLAFRFIDFRLRRGKQSGGLALRFLGLTEYFLIFYGAANGVAFFAGMRWGLGAYASAALVFSGAILILIGGILSRRMKDRLAADAEELSA